MLINGHNEYGQPIKGEYRQARRERRHGAEKVSSDNTPTMYFAAAVIFIFAAIALGGAFIF